MISQNYIVFYFTFNFGGGDLPIRQKLEGLRAPPGNSRSTGSAVKSESRKIILWLRLYGAKDDPIHPLVHRGLQGCTCNMFRGSVVLGTKQELTACKSYLTFYHYTQQRLALCIWSLTILTLKDADLVCINEPNAKVHGTKDTIL